MRTFAHLTFLTVAAALLVGCGTDVDSLVRRQIILYNELAVAIENDAPQEKQGAIFDEMVEINETLEGMNLSETEKQRIATKFGDEISKGSRRSLTARLKKRQEAGLSVDSSFFEELLPSLKSVADDDPPSAADLPLAADAMTIDTEAIEAKAAEMQRSTTTGMQNFADKFRQLDQDNPND